MIVFSCARDSNYADIKKYGLRQSGMGHRLLRSLDAARKDCPGRVLAVELTTEDLKACKVKDDLVIAPAVRLQAFRNLNPYAAVEPIRAAGGVIVRWGEESLEVILIHRRGHWDLPKGKRDGGESVEECALREVVEELGIRDSEIEVVASLPNTVHGYREGERFMLKTTSWFLMHTTARRFQPQSEEEIDRVEWFAWDDARDRVGYDTLRDLLKSARPVAKKHM